MNVKTESGKGPRLEETLLAYFIDAGFYAIRDIKFVYQQFDVTDIDIWLYNRPSTFTRERIIVDIKNKKTPQAIERIFWTKGLQKVIGVERSIVATTDKRNAVIEFGQQNEVLVLDGKFLSRLTNYPSLSKRLSEEEFINLLNANSNEFKEKWLDIYVRSKSKLLSNLDFSGSNYWLSEIHKLIEASLLDQSRREVSDRLIYLLLSFVLISFDYIYKDLNFVDQSYKLDMLNGGLLYGAKGKSGLDNIISTSMKLIEQYTPNGNAISKEISRDLKIDFEKIQVNILTEFFLRADVVKSLYTLSKSFRNLAYLREYKIPSSLDSDSQSVLGVILDYFQIPRKSFFQS